MAEENPTQEPAWLEPARELLRAHAVSPNSGFVLEQALTHPNFRPVYFAAATLPGMIRLPELDSATGKPLEEWPRQVIREQLDTLAPMFRHFQEDVAVMFDGNPNDPAIYPRILPVLRDLQFFVQAYLHTPGQEPAGILPEYLAVPIYNMTQALGLSVQAGYLDVVIANGKFVHEGRPESVPEYVFPAPLPDRTFTGMEEEAWFYHIHQVIESRSVYSLLALAGAITTLQDKSLSDEEIEGNLHQQLVAARRSIANMSYPMTRMKPGVRFEGMHFGGIRKDFFLEVLRPFLAGTEDYNAGRGVMYAGTPLTDPVREPGGSGAESALFPFWDAILGVKHTREHSRLITDRSRPFIPRLHKRIIDLAADHSAELRERVERNPQLRGRFDRTVAALFNVRKAHGNLVGGYLPEDARGLGGSIPKTFFAQMLEDTRDAMFSRTKAAALRNPWADWTNRSAPDVGQGHQRY